MRTLKNVVAILLTCALAASCEDPPTGPSPQRVTPPPPPGQPVLTGLELTGQTTLAPGATSEFTLIASFSDGTRTDVTSTAQWRINSAQFASSLGQGRYRAVANGEATVHVRYSDRDVSREIVIVPDGTFRVTGRIFEDDGVTPVSLAHVRVRDREESGLSTNADVNGFYRLYGVRPEVDFVVTRAGFAETERKHLTIDTHTILNISLPLAGPRLTVDGNYTVTFDWSNCSNGFRDDLRRRVYGAVLKQSGAEVEVRFTEPSFVHNSANRGDLMQGHVDPSGMYLNADSGFYYSYYGAPSSPFLVELLPDSYRLTTTGAAFLPQSGGRFSGAMTGRAQLSRGSAQFETFLGECRAGSVSFERR
jgi:hypothetical protein